MDYNKLFKTILNVPINYKLNYINNINKLIDKNKYVNFMKNKKVAVIGPSPSIRKIEDGEEIEKKFDVIVRINKGWKHETEMDKYIGKRTDVLYNCMDPSDECGGIIDIDYLINNSTKFIIDPIRCNFNDRTHRDNMFHSEYRLNNLCFFHKYNNNRISFDFINDELYEYYDKSAQTRLNTGLLAIMHILSFDIKCLYIKGFTFFKDGYISGYRDVLFGKKVTEKESTNRVLSVMKNAGNHDQDKQLEFLKKEYIKYKNKLIITPTLKKILEIK
tara:strand:- start:2073 stop:2894 length:822 start_codon:yes stop_codon:yes gene_type:complete